MALHHYPRIVTDGLILHLDAGNKQSWRGPQEKTDANPPEGFWYSMTDNNYRLTSRSLAYSQWYPGPPAYFNFTGAGDNHQWYIEPALTDIQDNLTIETWTYTNGSATGDLIFNYDTWFHSVQYQWITSYWGGKHGLTTSAVGYMSDFNKWYQTCSVWDDDTSDLIHYVNGQSISTREGYASGTGNTPDPALWIGARYPTGGFFQWAGKLASVKIYNRALSGGEIQQNYNALKWRFQ